MVLLDFTGVKEAQEFSPTIKEGYLSTQITAATEGETDNGKSVWVFEYTVQSGQYKGEVVKDTVYLQGSDDDKTKKLLAKIKRMYSRILNIDLNKPRECKPSDFLGKYCMVKIKQQAGKAKDDGRIPYYSNIEFAGFYSIQDYKPEFDADMKHSEAYLKSLEAQPEAAAERPAGF